MRHLTLAFSLAALAVPAAAQDGPILLSPDAIGQIFCLSRVGNDMAPVEGLLTADLSVTIREAEAKSEAIAAAQPGDKPPLGDGVPWQAYPDYAATCAVGSVAIDGSQATVTLDYGFPEAPEANFTDTLTLTAVDDPQLMVARWRIDNVVYAGGNDLRTALEAVFASWEK